MNLRRKIGSTKIMNLPLREGPGVRSVQSDKSFEWILNLSLTAMGNHKGLPLRFNVTALRTLTTSAKSVQSALFTVQAIRVIQIILI